ncbi:MAG: hypothetical protein ABW073_08570 [Acidimicrobiia bacterium]
MSELREAFRAVAGIARPVPPSELWTAAGLLADTLPLDRSPRYARRTRQFGHCVRLIAWDRAFTNRDASALMVLSQPPWLAAGAAAVVAAAVAPRIPRWMRGAAGAACIFTVVLRRDQLRNEFAVQRLLQEVAPDGLLIEHLVARAPDAAIDWCTELLDAFDRNGYETTFVALLPGARRDRARERLYRRWGFEVAARTEHRGRELTVLVRRTGTRASAAGT